MRHKLVFTAGPGCLRKEKEPTKTTVKDTNSIKQQMNTKQYPCNTEWIISSFFSLTFLNLKFRAYGSSLFDRNKSAHPTRMNTFSFFR